MLVVVGLLAIGWVLARVGAVPERTDVALDRVVLSVSLPALILARLPELDLTAAVAVPVVVAWTQLVVLVVVLLAVSRAAGWSTTTRGTLLICVPLGNTSFLGVPAVEALLGAEHVPFAIVYDQLGSFLALATWGSFVAARYGAGDAPSVASVVRRVLTFPPFVALVVAFVVRSTGLPATVEELAEVLAATLVPLAMLAIGLRLRLPERASLGPLLGGLGLRMVAVPAVVLAVAVLVGADGLAWETTVLESGMPPMVTAGVVATAAGLDERLATALVGGGILVALVSLPVLAALVP